MNIHKKWTLLIKDINGNVVFRRPFFWHHQAVKMGRYLTSPPLSYYEVEKA